MAQGGWGKLINQVHRLFDPRVEGKPAQAFVLRYPDEEKGPANPDLTVKTEPEAPPDSALERLKARADVAERQVDRALDLLQSDLSHEVTLSLGRLKSGLHADRNSDVVVRSVALPFPTPVTAHLVYIDGAVTSTSVEQAIIKPLMTLPADKTPASGIDLLNQVEQALLPGRQLQQTFSLSTALGGVVSGQCALLLEGVRGMLLVEVRGWPGRGVEAPKQEMVVRGPQESFTETLRTNTALLRRRMMTPDLVFEPAQVGRQTRANIALAYLDGVVNPALLQEIRYRISKVDVDLISDSGVLEQFLEDSPKSLFPTINSTERPDRAAAAISEGRAAVLVDGSPYVLLLPSVFGDFFRNPEDYTLKWPFGTFLRVVRVFGAMTTLLLPALYIAIATYHQEMIPSSLLLAIASSREAVPFPAFVEVLMMEIAFEIIREGSLRVPSVLGQTIGIVGALILGQAAVQASIVSPILVIIVATTALGSFTIPNYAMGLALRLLRFVFILLAATFGLYGVAAGLFILSAHAASLRSFGVPYLAPLGPRSPSSPDRIMRGELTDMDLRPGMLHTADVRRQAPDPTAWNPLSQPEKGVTPPGPGAD